MNDRARFAVDLGCVAVFAAVGRLSHAESLSPAGWWHTFWPFGFGLVFGWLLLLRLERPTHAVAGGVLLTVATVAGGMLIRSATGQGTAAAFVVVATVVLGVLLIGSRVRRARG